MTFRYIYLLISLNVRVLNTSINRTACLVSFGVATSLKIQKISSKVILLELFELLELNGLLVLDEEIPLSCSSSSSPSDGQIRSINELPTYLGKLVS